MNEQDFTRHADQALADLERRVTQAAETYTGENAFEADYNAGALVIEFDESHAKFVVSPNSSVQQIWVSANLASHKLAWDSALGAFTLPNGGAGLPDLVASAISEHMGTKITL